MQANSAALTVKLVARYHFSGLPQGAALETMPAHLARAIGDVGRTPDREKFNTGPRNSILVARGTEVNSMRNFPLRGAMSVFERRVVVG
jgi:hypothetical protein